MKSVDPFPPGHTLGKYEIVRELATGVMTRIYLARARGAAGFEREVVLKCILPHLTRDRAFVDMFLGEARLAATLRHSNIADVFDVGAVDDTYYFAMEYVAGENARTVRLRAKEANRPIPLEVAIAIVAGTASALEYAHTRESPSGPLELVHRDIAPSNILVGREGAVKLADFGIARATTRGAMKVRTALRRGKTPYLSPEQCRGQAIDGRSDLFSLGIVLYELATGERPFRGRSDFEVMEAIVEGHPAPPSSLVPGLPAQLDAIVGRLLARSPDARYQTASQLLEALAALVASAGIRTGAHVVARYMDELFGDAPVVERRDWIEPPPLPSPDELDPPTFRRDKRASTPAPDAFAESTQPEVVPAFDPVDAFAGEILDGLDDGAAANETTDMRATRRARALMNRSLAFVQTGEIDKAVAAIELVLDEVAQASEATHLLEDNIDTLVGVYEVMLEGPYRVLALARTPEEIESIPMEDDSRTLLPWIDGQRSIHAIIEGLRMHRLEAYHHLCQLLMRGVVR